MVEVALAGMRIARIVDSCGPRRSVGINRHLGGEENRSISKAQQAIADTWVAARILDSLARVATVVGDGEFLHEVQSHSFSGVKIDTSHQRGRFGRHVKAGLISLRLLPTIKTTAFGARPVQCAKQSSQCGVPCS